MPRALLPVRSLPLNGVPWTATSFRAAIPPLPLSMQQVLTLFCSPIPTTAARQQPQLSSIAMQKRPRPRPVCPRSSIAASQKLPSPVQAPAREPISNTIGPPPTATSSRVRTAFLLWSMRQAATPFTSPIRSTAVLTAPLLRLHRIYNPRKYPLPIRKH